MTDLPHPRGREEIESFREQLSRVEQMASDTGETWDLSENDQLALRAVLTDRQRMAEKLNAALSSASPIPPSVERLDLKALASAMRKVFPPELLAEVIAHLDPLTPFVEFLRSASGVVVPPSQKEP